MGAAQLLKKFVIRQDRHSVVGLSCFLKVDGKMHPMIDYSTFGVAIETTDNFHKGLQVAGSLHVGDLEVCSIGLNVVRTEANKVAFETVGDAIDTERFSMTLNALKSLADIRSDLNRYQSLPSEFKLLVYDLKYTLLKIEKRVQAAERALDHETFEHAMPDVMAGAIHQAIRECAVQLNKLIDPANKQQAHQGFLFFREQLRDVMDETTSVLFKKCIQRVKQMHVEGGGAHNRSAFMKQKIHGTIESFYPQKVKVLSVRSGPAFEVRGVFEELSAADCDRVEFTLMDQDVIALKNAQKSILKLAKESEKPAHLHLVQKPEGLSGEKYDLIYSAGLIDYLDDQAARAAVQALLGSLTETGRLVIGGFAASTPHQFALMTLFDWDLTFRSEQQLQNLFEFENVKLEIESDPDGTHLFCVIG